MVAPTGIGSSKNTVPFGLIVQSTGSTNVLLNIAVVPLAIFLNKI